MSRARPNDEKLLALLARMPGTVDSADVCTQLGWPRQRVFESAGRLERDGKVVREKVERAGEIGRPPVGFRLATIQPLPAANAESFELHTRVVMPSGFEAKVVDGLGRSRTFVEVEYVDGPEKYQRTTVHRALLRAYQPGRAKPEPVRIAPPPATDEAAA